MLGASSYVIASFHALVTRRTWMRSSSVETISGASLDVRDSILRERVALLIEALDGMVSNGNWMYAHSWPLVHSQFCARSVVSLP